MPLGPKLGLLGGHISFYDYDIVQVSDSGPLWSSCFRCTTKNPNLDLSSINAYIKFSKILSICSQDIERTRYAQDIEQTDSADFLKRIRKFLY